MTPNARPLTGETRTAQRSAGLSDGARAAIGWFWGEAPDDMTAGEAAQYIRERWGTEVEAELKAWSKGQAA